MDITKIVPPPAHPVYSGRPEDWELIERILEMKLPSDYKQLINNYGTGCFLEFLYPLSPFAPFDAGFNLLSGSARHRIHSYESGRKAFPQYSPPFPAYPQKNGLFPWAITINGDTLFWLREGEPIEWSVVVCDSKFSEEYDHFRLSATDFLCELLLGKIKSNVFPPGLLANGKTFKSYSKNKPVPNPGSEESY